MEKVLLNSENEEVIQKWRDFRKWRSCPTWIDFNVKEVVPPWRDFRVEFVTQVVPLWHDFSVMFYVFFYKGGILRHI